MRTYRILWGKSLENQVNDLGGVSFGQACTAAKDRLPKNFWGDDPGNNAIAGFDANQTPFIILHRRDGSSWKTLDSNWGGEEIYWDSIMKADDAHKPS